jgi:hypothetical protein
VSRSALIMGALGLDNAALVRHLSSVGELTDVMREACALYGLELVIADEAKRRIELRPKQEQHPDYVGVSYGGSGHFAVYMKWNTDHGGFYEPWNTGHGRYRTPDGAHAEAKAWAEAEGVEYRP